MGVFDNIMLARTAIGYLEGLVFQNNKKIAVLPSSIAGQEEEVKADVLFSWDYNIPVKITENPVENGVIVNDHRIILPQIITIDVGVSNIVGIEDIVFNRDVGTLIQASKLFIFGNRADSNSRVAAKFRDLLIAEYNGDPFDLITPYGIFPDMVISNIESTQDSESISVFRGRITYRKLIKYDVLRTAVTDVSGVNPLVKNGPAVTTRLNQSLVPNGVVF
jgi:hypothetical protein